MYSFDVFDTLITRRTAVPTGIFMLMQERIKRDGAYSAFLADNFFELRTGAERLARAQARSEGKQEITLGDIYRALSTAACMTVQQQEALKELELETECENVLGIAENIGMVKELLAQGRRVVLISDMYLGEKGIRRILEQADPVFHELPVYVSSDYGVTKGNGELFRVVRERENAEYADWVHYGDNASADIAAAQKLGIQAVRVAVEEAKEYEQPGKDLYHQVSVGISRYLRGGLKSVAGEIGCSLAGPILYPYMKWVLEQSLEKGIDRLYFVARDGWILQQIADRIIQIEHYPIQTIYLYGSRKAWRLPAYDASLEKFDRILKWSNMDEVLCLKDLAEVFQLSVEELQAVLAGGSGEIGEEKKLLRKQKENIYRQLRGNEAFRKDLVQRQRNNRRLVIGYLQQEMDVSDDRFAFVELAGTGFTQKCLADIMGDFYQGEIKNFFFKLDAIQENGQCVFCNFFPDSLKRSYMLELLCRAPHGQTAAYREEKGRIEPVLEPEEGEQTRAYGLEEYRDGVLSYVEHMERTWMGNAIPGMIRIGMAREYLETIAQNPPQRIADFFCHMPFSSGGRSRTLIEFAPPVTRKQLRRIYFWREEENHRNIYHGDSLDYALAVSPEAMRYSEKCKAYRKSAIGKWLVGWHRYLRTRQKPREAYFCSWEVLHGDVVIYGAGKMGRAYVKQAGKKKAKCNSLLWVDANYAKLQEEGLAVVSPQEIREHTFDRIIVAVSKSTVRQEIGCILGEMGIEAGKIYYG